jgi:hypothetical protein
MKRAASLVAAFMLMGSVGIAQPPIERKAGLAMYLQLGYGGIKADLIASAEKMPEADYGFKPGPMPEVRTFGQLFAHVAASQFRVCAAVRGVPNPSEGKNLSQELKTKVEVVKALADSFAFCDDAFLSTTEENALEFVRQGPNELTRASVLYGLLAHNSEMYGIGTVYLRLKGIVPPSTARQTKARGGAGG